MSEITIYDENTFESIKHINEDGQEYWLARELQPVLEYAQWRNFAEAIERAKLACKNSGFEIELTEELKPYYINYDEINTTILKKPHITASLSNEAEAVNTKNLNFIKLPQKYKVKGRFGYWIEDDDKEYLSFKKYTK